MSSEELKRYEVAECFVIGGYSDMQESPSGHYVKHSDYAALEERYECNTAIMHARTEALSRVTAERDAALAQLAAIQQAKGEEVEVVGYVNVRNGRRGDWLHRSEADARSHDRTALAGKPAGAEPEALMTIAQHQRITAAMAAEVERLRTALRKANEQTEHFERNWYLVSDERDALRAELGVRTAQRDAAQDSCAGLQAMVNDLAADLAAVKGG